MNNKEKLAKIKKALNKDTYDVFNGISDLPEFSVFARKRGLDLDSDFILMMDNKELEHALNFSPATKSCTAIDMFLEPIELAAGLELDPGLVYESELAGRFKIINNGIKDLLADDEYDTYYDFGFDIRERCKELGIKIPNDRELGKYDRSIEWE